MRLPFPLEKALEEALGSQKKAHLVFGREELSERYRSEKGKDPYITKSVHHFAYLAARLPATFAAVTKALEEVLKRVPALEIKTLLDLGTGPGTAVFAALELLPGLEKVTALEKDKALLALAKRLSNASLSINWQESDLEKIDHLPPHDLIILSYSIGELSPKGRERLIAMAAEAAKILVVIEPGTPAGFERIRKIRADLLQKGKSMIAPCPHHLPCPMPADDWCHFAVRLERSSLHREIKGGTLGYEDEKFSYVAVSNVAASLPEARILRHPQKLKGNVRLTLCTKANGLQEKIISKRTPEAYKEARRLEWGDTLTY